MKIDEKEDIGCQQCLLYQKKSCSNCFGNDPGTAPREDIAGAPGLSLRTTQCRIRMKTNDFSTSLEK